mmetsp:Transcript_2516/g.5542  ORF Transcript_2516/g.5542 Transcript_2516/m.5542 type:complete len:82 (-) Transcript_2516:52-297(-)
MPTHARAIHTAHNSQITTTYVLCRHLSGPARSSRHANQPTTAHAQQKAHARHTAVDQSAILSATGGKPANVHNGEEHPTTK